MKNLVCLISGRGSNLEAILARARDQRWEESLGARMAMVISNRPDARGLQIAERFGVATQVLEHGRFADRAAFDTALAQRIDACEPALVVLAGFLRVLTDDFVARYRGRMINVHPSLLPAFTGLDTHARALAAGVRIHGTTVHFVDAKLDAGPIIAQAGLAVLPGESEESLAARVLALEHKLLPDCIAWILQGKVRCQDGCVTTHGLGPAQLFTFAP
jgi:phosphoribosylglycinamide formyltransferase 1